MLPLLWLKIIVLASLFALTFFFSLIPLPLISSAKSTSNLAGRRRRLRIISFFSCFAGGVFLATCLLDLFPEVRHKLSTTFQVMEIHAFFPIAEFVMVFGFFLILVTEQCVLVAQESGARNRVRSGERESLLSEGEKKMERIGDEEGEGWLERSTSSIEGISDRPHLPQDNDDDDLIRSYGSINGDDDDGDHHELSLHEDPASHSSLRSLLLATALSLHSVFEGLALGLQPSSADLMDVCLALAIHKSIIAFSLGINLAESKLKRSRIIQSNFMFSISSPIGVGIGTAITDLGPHSNTVDLLSGGLQGVACGTFLYITFFEVLPHELNSSRDRLLKLLCILIGFATICALLFLHPDDAPDLCYQVEAVSSAP